MSERSFARTVRVAVLGLASANVLFPGLAGGQVSVSASSQPTGRWQDASLEGYRKHLEELRALTEACASARDLKTCDPTRVGPDDRVPIAEAGKNRRVVRYGWLRILLYRADEPDEAQKASGTGNVKSQDHKISKSRAGSEDGSSAGAPANSSSGSPRPVPRTTTQLLQDAEVRLTRDLAQAGEPVKSPDEHPAVRDTLKQVLGEREFRNLRQSPEHDTVLEKVGNWLNHLFAGVDKLRARSAWVGKALVWAFFLAAGSLVAWRLLRIERRWRARIISLKSGSLREAPSVRDWEAWLKDARRAAAEGAWREAIHFVYWASIARLESKRLWPADKARTPREYLALMAPGDPRTAGLASLTRSFERTWYGGREARESDYRQAEQTAAGLMAAHGLAEGDAS